MTSKESRYFDSVEFEIGQPNGAGPRWYAGRTGQRDKTVDGLIGINCGMEHRDRAAADPDQPNRQVGFVFYTSDDGFEIFEVCGGLAKSRRKAASLIRGCVDDDDRQIFGGEIFEISQ